MSFNTISILSPEEGELNDAPKKFTNIDKEDFEFERREILDQEVVDTLPNGQQEIRMQPVKNVYKYNVKAG